MIWCFKIFPYGLAIYLCPWYSFKKINDNIKKTTLVSPLSLSSHQVLSYMTVWTANWSVLLRKQQSNHWHQFCRFFCDNSNVEHYMIQMHYMSGDHCKPWYDGMFLEADLALFEMAMLDKYSCSLELAGWGCCHEHAKSIYFMLFPIIPIKSGNVKKYFNVLCLILTHSTCRSREIFHPKLGLHNTWLWQAVDE